MGILRFQKWLDADMLAFFVSTTVLATFQSFGRFFKSSGQTGQGPILSTCYLTWVEVSDSGKDTRELEARF